jgi:hypothetical protein
MSETMPSENEWREVLTFLIQLADGDIHPMDVEREASQLLRIWGER